MRAVLIGCLLLTGCGGFTGEWTYEEDTHPLTDEPMLAATVTDHQRNLLVVNCSEKGQPTLIIQTVRRMGGYGPDNEFLPRMITYRVDKAPPKRTLGTIGEDMIAFVSGEGDNREGWDGPIIAALPEASTLTIRTSDYQDEEILMTFPVGGAGPVLERFRERCKQP